MESREEDDLLRSVALQNAKSIMLARQRVEEELVQAKKALEIKTAELAQTLALTRATLEATTDGILATDNRRMVTEYNQRYLEMWRLSPPVLESGDHRTLVEHCSQHFRDPQHYLKVIENIYATAAPESFDVLEFLDGRVFERTSRIQMADGRNIGRVWNFHDITDRRRAEETQFHLAAVVNSSDDAIVSKNLDGIIRSWNEGAQRIFGYAAEEVIGKPITMLMPAERLHEETEILQRLRRGERVDHFDTVRMRKDGSCIDVSVTISPIRDAMGVLIGASNFARDISGRKRAERTTAFLANASAALAELTDYQSTLQKVAALAVPFFADWCAVDMLSADGAVDRLAIVHADAAKVELVRELQRRFPSDPANPSGVLKVLRTGTPEWVAEISDALLVSFTSDPEYRRLVKSLKLKSYICVPLQSRGRTIGALTFATAESGAIYGLDDLRAAEDLASRAAIAIENANLLATLKEADRRKDEFLATLAHELRNPLAPIGNAMQILRMSATDEPTVRSATDMIDRQVGYLVRLVDDLLDVSRITRGKIELRREKLDLGAVATHAVESASAQAQCMEHHLTINLPAQPVYVNADATRLAQIIGNLLNNACKFTDKGGNITLTIAREGDTAVIRVRDKGIGISADQVGRIFDMFTQLDTSLERSQSGLGIGLTLVKNLAEMHGGSVEAHSAGVGHGTEFVVRLPVAAATAKTSSATAGALVVMSGRRILVVDDNRDAATSLVRLLQMTGNETEIAHDGLEAVAAAERFRPELILLDIGLPKINGYEAARRIREQPWGKGMVLVALTGWGQEEDRQQSKAAGFNGHLVKPVKLSNIENLVASLLSKPD